MKIKPTLLAGLLAATVVLAACGQSESTPVATPAATEKPAMETSNAAESSATAKEDGAMAKDEGTMAKEDGAMAKEGDGQAMAQETPVPTAEMMAQEGGAMAKETAMPAATDMVKEDGGAAATDEGEAMAMPAWYSAELIDVNSGQPFTVADHKGKVVLVETLAVWCSNCMRQQKQVKELHEALGQRDDFVSVGLDIDLNESADQLREHAARNGFDWVYAIATADVAREIGKLYGNQFLNPPATPMLIVDRQGEAHPLPFGIKSAADLQAALAPFLDEAM